MHTPIDSLSRGRLRQWRRTARERYDRVQRIVDSKQFLAASSDFGRKHGLGRERALARLRVLLKAARFQHSRLTDPSAHVLWAVLKPRGSIIDGDEAPGRLQDCVTVDYIAAGAIDRPEGTPFVGHSTGFWSLEVQDHALGRLIQRCPSADIEAVVWQAFDNALSIEFGPMVGRSLVLPAGPGAFIAEALGGCDKDTGGTPFAFLQCRTWVSEEMALAEPVATTTTPGLRLGDGPLLPMPLRRLWSTPEARP